MAASARKTGKAQKAKSTKTPATARRRGQGGRGGAKAPGKSPKGRRGRTGPENPPAPKDPIRLTLIDRVHRAREIAALRARTRPVAWAKIAKEIGLSSSQTRQVYADYLRWAEPEKDPMAVVEETIDCMKAAMIEASDTAAHAEAGSSARVTAIRSFMEAATTRLALMQAAGKVPRWLGSFQAERELRTVLQEFADLLKRHNITGEALREFLELAESVQSRRRAAVAPAQIEGKATEKAA